MSKHIRSALDKVYNVFTQLEAFNTILVIIHSSIDAQKRTFCTTQLEYSIQAHLFSKIDGNIKFPDFDRTVATPTSISLSKGSQRRSYAILSHRCYGTTCFNVSQ
jgi:hypothetical protein